MYIIPVLTSRFREYFLSVVKSSNIVEVLIRGVAWGVALPQLHHLEIFFF